MAAPSLRPRSAGEIVDAAFQILRAHYAQFVLCSALAYVPLLVLRLVVIGDPSRLVTGEEATIAGAGAIWASMLALFASWITFTLMSAVLLICTSSAYLGEEVDVASAVRRALPRLPLVMVSGVLRYLLMMIGFLAFIFPALYVVARYFAVTAVIVLENAGLGAAFSRSSALSKGRKRHVLNTLGLAAIIYWVLVMGFTLASAITGSFVVQTVVSAVVTVLVYPVIAIVEGLLYYDARIQSEGLDIELMTGALAPASELPTR